MSNLLNDTKTKKTYALEIILLVVLILFIAFTIFTTKYWIFISYVDGNSMETTLSHGDMLITDRLSVPKRGEIIVFKYSENKDYIKRVIAVEGDVVEIKEGYVYLKKSGETTFEKLDEPYLLSDLLTPDGGYWVVGDNEYFVLGDNRINSSDSRYIGTIKESQIKGVVHNFWVKIKVVTTSIFGIRG